MVICEHLHVTPLEGCIKGFSNPITCDDCGKILECEHEELEHTELYYCTTCGNPVIDDYVDYDVDSAF